MTQGCDALYMDYRSSFLFLQRLEDAMSKYWLVEFRYLCGDDGEWLSGFFIEGVSCQLLICPCRDLFA
jgi:hypothetical protein